MGYRNFLLAIVFLNSVSQFCFSQNDTSKGLEIIQAGSFKNIKMNDTTELRYLESSKTKQVILKKDSTWIYCQKATQFLQTNNISASQNIFITNKKSITLTGDSLFYDTNLNKALIFGKKVVLKNDSIKIVTDEILYDISNEMASYHTGGVITTPTLKLSSQKGKFFLKKEILAVRKNVYLENPDDSLYITGDTLTFFLAQNKIFFDEPTTIKIGDKTILTEKGSFETLTNNFMSTSETVIENKENKIKCGTIFYWGGKKEYSMTDKVSIFDKKENTTLHSDSVFSRTEEQFFKAMGNVFFERMVSPDTLLLLADTLIYLYGEKKQIWAYYDTKFYHNQLFGICDSLEYNQEDAMLYAYLNPIFWNDASEIKADTLSLHLVDKKPNKLFINKNAFIISLDTLIEQFQQLKGRNMIGHFQDNQLEKLEVNGNGEALFFIKDSLILTGMNRMECSNMLIYFDDNQLDELYFFTSPVARFIPPHKIQRKDLYLENFRENFDKKPKFPDFFSKEIMKNNFI